jgi:hypothetical protein
MAVPQNIARGSIRRSRSRPATRRCRFRERSAFKALLGCDEVERAEPVFRLHAQSREEVVDVHAGLD